MEKLAFVLSYRKNYEFVVSRRIEHEKNLSFNFEIFIDDGDAFIGFLT